MILFGNGRTAVATLLEDDAGELADWLRKYLPVAVADLFVRPPAHRELALSVADGRVLSVPTPNWPPQPEVRFNRLYWPTGATRWAHCFLLATTEIKNKIIGYERPDDETVNPGVLTIAPNGWTGKPGETGQLLDDEGVMGLGASMYCLPPRRVVVEYLTSTDRTGAGTSDGLWIIPLVDHRYFWQFGHVPSDYAPTSWEMAFTDILNGVGVEEDKIDEIEAFDTGYGEPELELLEFHNAAMALDALAFTVGRRIVVDLDGTVRVQTHDEADTVLEGNRDHQASSFQQIAGGDDDHIGMLAPESLTLSFPGSEETSTVTSGERAIGVDHVIHVAKDGDDDAAYAAAFSVDWYAWIQTRYHETYAGAKKWEPCGYDDAIEWCLGSRLDGELQAITRVKTLPYNWGMTTLLRFGDAPASDDDDDDDSDDDCDCAPCIQGVNIPDGTQCCTSLLTWTFPNPWMECATTELIAEYIGNDQWLTNVFEGPEGNSDEFQYHVTIDIDGRSYLTLVRKTDNGGDPVCLIYGRDSFNCQCANEFFLHQPYGRWMGVERADLACSVCLQPSDPLSGIPDFVPGPYCEVDLTEVPVTIQIIPTDTAFGECTPANGFCIGVLSLDLSRVNEQITVVLSDVQYSTGGEVTVIEYSGQIDIGGESATVTVRYENCATTLLIELDCPKNNLQDTYFFSRTVLGGFPNEQIEISPAVGGPSGDPCLIYPGYFLVGASGDSTIGGSPSETGVCDETCDPTPAPVDPDSGACCFQGNCFDHWDEALCNDFGGTWHADIDECLEDCETMTACCINGTCVILNEFACHYLVGTPVPGGACDPNPCGEEGACCHDDDSCTIETEEDCQGAGDWFNGVGTACIDFDCTVGACCYRDPEEIVIGDACICEEISHAECDTRENFGIAPAWGGDGTTCAGLGAGNCIEDGDCSWDGP